MVDMTQWRVLLVDDEPDSLMLIHDLLVLHGAQVDEASGGAECLSLLQSIIPTLVVMDLAMPKPDGWDVLAHIRSNPATAHVPVVAITAYHNDTLARQVLEAGFDAYFPKPIKSNDFLNRLQEVTS